MVARAPGCVAVYITEARVQARDDNMVGCVRQCVCSEREWPGFSHIPVPTRVHLQTALQPP